MRKILFFLLGALLISGCGQQQKRVKDLVIDSLAIDSDMHLLASALLDLGGIQLPEFKEKIIHPQLGEIGTVVLQDDNRISFQINLSTLTPNIVELDVRLPNGKKLPMIGDTPSIVLPVKGTSIKFYIALAQGSAVAGFALPFKEFGGELGDEYGSFSVMPSFKVKGHKVAGGLFYGERAGESGLGAFIDITKLVGLGIDGIPSPILTDDDDYELDDVAGSEFSKDEGKASENYLLDLSNNQVKLEIY